MARFHFTDLNVPEAAIVTGSRHWKDASLVRTALEPVPAKLIVGGAPGVDTIVERAFQERTIVIRAEWHLYGGGAGPRRNQRMLERLLTFIETHYCTCLAFPLEDSRGTWDMVRRARMAGIPIFIWKSQLAKLVRSESPYWQ